jgi:hypothetical protein
MSYDDNSQFVLSDQNAVDVLAIRKLELLLDVLAALENANSPDLYGVKMAVVDKISKAVENL